jgi:hypothetical protein
MKTTQYSVRKFMRPKACHEQVTTRVCTIHNPNAVSSKVRLLRRWNRHAAFEVVDGRVLGADPFEPLA